MPFFNAAGDSQGSTHFSKTLLGKVFLFKAKKELTAPDNKLVTSS